MEWNVAEEIDFLSRLSGVPYKEFRHVLVSRALAAPEDNTATSIFNYTPAENRTWVVTLASIRSLPPVDDPSLTVGDWRSFDFDASGTADLYWTVKQTAVTPIDNTYFAISNRACLLAFKGGNRVDLFAQRNTLTPPTERLVVCVNSYLAPAHLYDRLTNNLTVFEVSA